MSIALKIPKKNRDGTPRVFTAADRRNQRYRAVVHLGDNKYRKCPWRLLKSEAEADELTARIEIAQGAQPTRRTVAEYVESYETWYALKNDRSSLMTLQGITKLLVKDLGGVPMADVDGAMAEAWASGRPSVVPMIRALWNRAIERREPGVEWNPFRGLFVSTGGRDHLIPLSAAEVAKLAACARKKFPGEYGQELAAAITFGAYSGMRPGELFMLRWDAVDFNAQRIAISQRVYRGDEDEPKRGPKLVRLFAEAERALRDKPRGDGDYVFTGQQGGRLTQPTFSRYWQKIVEEFGPRADKFGVLAAVQPYELRHFMGHHVYVTLGMPARVAAAQLGHKDETQIVKTYGHGDHGALDELDRHFGTPTPLRAVR